MLKVIMKWSHSFLGVLLFLCLIHPCSGNKSRNAIMALKDATRDVLLMGNDNTVTTRYPLSFGPPAFVSGMFKEKEFLAVIFDAFYDKSSGSTVFEPVVKTSNEDHKQWSNANIILNSTVSKGSHKYIGMVTAVMKNGKIYVLATSFDTPSELKTARDGDIKWDSFVIVGTLIKSPKPINNNDVTIMWGKEKSLKSLFTTNRKAQGSTYFFGGMGNGVVMKDGTIVLPILIKHKDKTYDSASIIYSKDDGETWKMGKKTISGSSQGSVVEFGEGTLLFSVQSSNGVRAVYKTNDMGATWRTSESFMAVWGNNPSRSLSGSQGSVITASVEGKDVLLFAHPLNTDKNGIRDTLQLWVSDGQRIALVGTISEDKKGEHTGNSILAYINNKLYITHEIIPHAETQAGDEITGLNKFIAVTHLQDYFAHVKKIVLAWREVDKQIAQTGDISTDGLVGFLGNTKINDGVWTDKYNCVNATVKCATRVNGGFIFSGAADSGAQWSVGSQGQNQLYKFTRKQFTIAATVNLHSLGGTDDVMLLGASVNTAANNILIGIGCSKDNQWYTFYDKKVKHFTTLSCEVDKEYHVALTHAYGVTHFYLNGSYLTIEKQTNPKSLVIQQFFMGKVEKDSPAEVSMYTVKNVMLFNQRLEQRKIFHLYRVSNNRSLDKLTEIEELAPLPVTHPSAQTTQPATIILSDNSVQKTMKPAPQPVINNADQTGNPQNPLVTPNTVQRTKPAATTVSDNSAHPEELPNAPVNSNSGQTTKPAIKPASDKAPSIKTSEQAAVTEKHKPFNASKSGNHLDIALGAQQSATIKKNLNPTDSSAVSFAFFPLMCLVSSVILLVEV